MLADFALAVDFRTPEPPIALGLPTPNLLCESRAFFLDRRSGGGGVAFIVEDSCSVAESNEKVGLSLDWLVVRMRAALGATLETTRERVRCTVAGGSLTLLGVSLE